MNTQYNRIKNKLEESLEPTTLKLIDDSNDHAGHYEKSDDDIVSHLTVIISSKKFDGLNKVKCHQIVNNALKDEFACGLHALRIQIIEENN